MEMDSTDDFKSRGKVCVCGSDDFNIEVSCDAIQAYDYKFMYCGKIACRNAMIDLMIKDLSYDYIKEE